ncbi:MAG: hypothetical protein Kapaf2KO_05950 [Candidatus Kapaibacteriales bacterium]
MTETNEIEIINKIPVFLTLNREEQKSFLEVLIFSSEFKLSARDIINILSEKDDYFGKYKSENPDHSVEDLQKVEETYEDMMSTRFALNSKYLSELIKEINIDLEKTKRPFLIVDFAGGYQYATRNEHSELVASVLKAKSKKRLSKAQLETLAIIAYKQPVTNPEIESIRGARSKDTVNNLIEKEFVTVLGRSEKVGKPLLYGTTEQFMISFGLKSMSDLPNMGEIEELLDSKAEDEDLSKVKINVNPTTMEEEPTETKGNSSNDFTIKDVNQDQTEGHSNNISVENYNVDDVEEPEYIENQDNN